MVREIHRNGKAKLVQRGIGAIMIHSGIGAWRIHNTPGISSVYGLRNNMGIVLLEKLSMARKAAGAR
jgi:hypothetical protein